MPKADKKEKKPDNEKSEEAKELIKPLVDDGSDEFDFGGLPADVSFKRNMGCGG